MTKVIICLGCNFRHPENKVINQARINKAVELYFQKEAKKIILSGGFYSQNNLSEAKFLAGLALQQKVPMKDLILEEKSISTKENAEYCHQIMEQHHFESAVVITSPNHLPRAKYLFKKIIPSKELVFQKSEEKVPLKRYLQEIYALIRLRIFCSKT